MICSAHEAVLDHSDLFRITLHGDDVQEFDTRWGRSFAIGPTPSDDIQENLCKMRAHVSDQLKTVLALYEQEIDQHNSQPNYQKLKTMVRRCVDQKIRARNVEARNERIETGVPLKARSKGKNVSAGPHQLWPSVCQLLCLRSFV